MSVKRKHDIYNIVYKKILEPNNVYVCNDFFNIIYQFKKRRESKIYISYKYLNNFILLDVGTGLK